MKTRIELGASTAAKYWCGSEIPRSPLPSTTRFLRWHQTDSEENYFSRGNAAFSVEDVGYEFNSLGYRCGELTRDPGSKAILFLGDSNTAGVGMPVHAIWPSLVAAAMEQHWGQRVQQFNLGWGGTGSDFVAMMLHQTVDVLQPDAVVVLWSYLARISWYPNASQMVHFVPEYVPPYFRPEHDAFLRLATEADCFFNFVRNFLFVNEILLRRGIPMYWGNIENLAEVVLQPYLPLGGFVGNWKVVDRGRDGRHAGVRSHADFASKVVKAAVQYCGPKRGF
jgi:hypothetical protein